jgi:IS5 family transposase
MLRIHCPDVLADAGYQGVDTRNPDLEVNWHVAMRPGKQRTGTRHRRGRADQGQHPGQGRAPVRAIKQQLFALSNLWMGRRQRLGLQA